MTEASKDHLLIGYSGDEVSILAHKEVWGSEDPVFEILDHQRIYTYQVREISTPERTQELIKEHDGPAEEERGNPYKLDMLTLPSLL